ncbi:flagellar filament capping protein FliD [Castellaniella caeni]|uniref:flagellar filament capping protein FliD n=1 Tax=Castellaniella caeni TaxID=266123 RepID=UPI000835781C|nr:flagellar filament capping protein FliD [Castellaniella caeni]
MATVSSLGLSGLPLTDLLTNLQNNESQSLVLIKNRQTDAQNKLSAYGKLKDAISAFQKTADAVVKPEAFGAMAATTGSDAFSVTTTPQAIAGQYSVNVNQLATSQTLVYAGQTDRTTSIGTGGTLSVTLANGETKTLDLGDDTSLNGLAKAINADKDIGINATIVNDGSGTPYRLLLTGRETGADNAATSISVTGNDDLNTFLQYNGSDTATVTQGQAAQDAELTINGIAIHSGSNVIDNVIDGVKLTLNKTTTEATSLNLTQDNTAAKKAVSDFVKAYNSLLDTIDAQTKYDTTSQTSQPLTGDSVTRSVQTSMRDAISGAFDPTQGLNLSQAGITTDPKTGRLSVDDAKLDKALSDNPDAVKSLFSGDLGAGKRVSQAADSFIKFDGKLTNATDGLNKTIADIKKQYDQESDRIDQRMETYRAQFTQLDTMVSQMNSLTSYLSQQFSALSASKG